MMLFWSGLFLGALLMIPAALWLMRWSGKEARRRENQQASRQRLAELKSMTGGLAHEIKNPLSSINLNLQLLGENVGELVKQGKQAPAMQVEAEAVERRLKALSREIDHLRDILQDFLRFAGRMQLEREPTDLNELVSDVADFFVPQAEQAGLHLRTQLLADPAVAPVDVSLLKQAILNLMINATKATEQARQAGKPHGGADELMIRTERVGAHLPEIGSKSRRRSQDSQSSAQILIHVTDTGPGIDPQVRERIFEPYFSTHRGGTGLGLPTTRRIIEEHGGSLTVVSELGQGSDFIIALQTEVQIADQEGHLEG